MFRKTKIVCTIGPASDSEETIKKLFEAGMNASRHNFSHGTHETHKVAMDKVKKVAAEMGINYAIILDTKGPEIRTKNFKDGKVVLKEGTEVTVVGGEDFLGDEKRFAITYSDLAEVMKPGNHILLNDGLVDLEVTEVVGKEVKTIVRNTGEISDHKSSNLPGVKTNLPSLTEKDAEDLKFAVENDIDIVAASFIRKAEDVLNIRKVLHEAGGSKIHIYSKIENQEGVDNVEDIIKFSDGIMVARGDLGVEIPLERVPVIQKKIIELCNKAGKPVITATQMLDSMVRNPRPTRAEVSDVANAIMDGSDAIMLSGETASGKYPVETVTTMAHIAEETEKGIDYEQLLSETLINQTSTVQSAISAAVTATANKLKARAIITGTQSGSTARNIAKFKPKATIIAVTPVVSVARKLALNWGVYPIVSEVFETTDELIEKTSDAAKEKGFVADGDLV
ncbi:MAG: pyruvate kinase, partial [Clostridiaceae bacterium]